MFQSKIAKTPKIFIKLVMLFVLTQIITFEKTDALIITSVIAGNKKFKTVSFDSKFLKPLTFEKDLPSTEFRRTRTVRPPKFDIDVNIPIKLPVEEEYPQEEYKKPVESNLFFQTGEINEPNYDRKYPVTKQKSPPRYTDEQYAASSDSQGIQIGEAATTFMKDGFKGLLPALAKSIKIHPQFERGQEATQQLNARSDNKDATTANNNQQRQQMNQYEPLAPAASYQSRNYAPPQYGAKNYGNNHEQEFVPGGFINLQLSGPSGGPKMTYEDIDKERWAHQLSETEGAMPYPILNYHQLQNFYGGLGTFTNGLAEHRYVQSGLLDKLKHVLNHFTSKAA